ncbi:MAG TPA: hydrogenase iron-sulfur subunit, partial [Anaerolineae bacterium]|nr:hydrogenase iron-sulfur subunit [Anaerolineae bacterium]
LESFEQGADGVYIVACPIGNCHHADDQGHYTTSSSGSSSSFRGGSGTSSTVRSVARKL